MQKLPFTELNLSPEVLKAIAALGFEEASPIQAAAIPVMRSGRDLVGQSQTGSGKTAAFAIPLVEMVEGSSRAVQALVLCPTRELATQVAADVHKLGIYKTGLHSVPIYGGASYERQFHELKKGVQIVIGTPGRVIDHIERGTLDLSEVRAVVLDEADRMLDMGFRDDITRILDSTPSERQTVFFSATLSKPIRDLINRYARDPETVKIEQKAVSAPAIEQWFYETHHRDKLDALIRLIDYHGFKLGIIFCNTQRMVDELADALSAQGFSSDRLHGGIAQAQRTRVMNKFKKAEFEFLVATDVAARGIDVDNLEIVVNYDLPYDAEDYVHRIGRTGRAGRRGMSVTFVSGREIYRINAIEKFTRSKIQRGKLPTATEVEERRADLLVDRVRALLDGDEWRLQMPLVDRLLGEGLSSSELAAVLFHMLQGTGGSGTNSESERPTPSASRGGDTDYDVKRPSPKREPARESGERVRETRATSKRVEGDPDLSERPRPAYGKRWISIDRGRSQGMDAAAVVDLLTDKFELEPPMLGQIEVGAGVCYVEVPEQTSRAIPLGGFAMDAGDVQIVIKPVLPSFALKGGKPPTRGGGGGGFAPRGGKGNFDKRPAGGKYGESKFGDKKGKSFGKKSGPRGKW